MDSHKKIQEPRQLLIHNQSFCVCHLNKKYVCVILLAIAFQFRSRWNTKNHWDIMTMKSLLHRSSRVIPILPRWRDACQIFASGWVIAMKWLKLIQQITITCHYYFIANTECKYFWTGAVSSIQNPNSHS